MNTKSVNPRLTIASANFSIREIASEGEFIQRIEQLCTDAKRQDVDLLVLPEYCMLAHLAKVTEPELFSHRIARYAESHAEKLLEIMRKIARRTNLSLVTGSMPIQSLGRLIVNRSYLINNEGRVLHEQDKIMMTRFERETWHVSSGATGLRIFNWRGFRCVIAICYDVEFPFLLGKAFAMNKGIDIIFTPSCTDTEHGYWRVRHSAMARAIEWQCVAVVASVIHGIEAIPDIANHFGRAAILGPCDQLFPANGCLAESVSNSEGLAIASIKLEDLEQTRTEGSVFLSADQIRQYSAPVL